MAETVQPNDLLKGSDLKAAVKNKFEAGLKNARTNGNQPKAALITACRENFDEVAKFIDWDIPRTEGDIKPLPGNFSAATQYALLKTGNDMSRNYNLQRSSDWWKIVNGVLSSDEQRPIFIQNFWRSPMVVRPRRGIPLQYILPHFFGEQPITGIDLGAGLHVALPMLNSESFTNTKFEGRANLPGTPVNITLGIGVDKQLRELDWATASEDPGPNAKTNVSELHAAYQNAISKAEKFPFTSASVFEIAPHLKARVDFAFSSFLRHQLGTALEIQDRFRRSVGQAVKEGGCG